MLIVEISVSSQSKEGTVKFLHSGGVGGLVFTVDL